jgi:hypothetical protein
VLGTDEALPAIGVHLDLRPEIFQEAEDSMAVVRGDS